MKREVIQRISVVRLVIIGLMLGSCSSSKVKSYPQWVGHRDEDKILICNLNLNTSREETLKTWTNHRLGEELPSLRIQDQEDVNYTLKMHALVLPSFDNYDTTGFAAIRQLTGLRYILLTKIGTMDDHSSGVQPDANYRVREAALKMRLIDLTYKAVVWHCSASVRIAPFIYSGKEDDYYFNITDANTALNKAYRKSIKKLIKALDYYYPTPVNELHSESQE